MLDHLARVALRLGPVEIGEFDGGNEPIAQSRVEAPFEHERQRGRTELHNQSADDFDRDDACQCDQNNGKQHDAQAMRRLLDPVELEHLEDAEIQREPEPEPNGQRNPDDGQPLKKHVTPDRAREPVERVADGGRRPRRVRCDDLSSSHQAIPTSIGQANRNSFRESHSTESSPTITINNAATVIGLPSAVCPNSGP